MKLPVALIGLCCAMHLIMAGNAKGQVTPDSTFKPKGTVWGVGFGDFAYKMDADPSNRGFTNQYTSIPDNQSMFQFRRIYLGYDYEISKRFVGNFLLAMEDNAVVPGTNGAPVNTGDLLTNGRYSLFIKNANVTWKNIFKGTDVSLGMVHTPAAVLLPEVVWDYRCIERTISEMRRTPAWDMGLIFSGKFFQSDTTELGYNFMIGNGTASRPENDAFKWFYGDIYGKFFKKRLIIDLYADYNRQTLPERSRRERMMYKGLLAWSGKKFTIGAEAFTTSLRNNATFTLEDNNAAVRDIRALNYSVFARGRVYKELLGFFVRYDSFDPSLALIGDEISIAENISPNYSPFTSEQFFTAGFDYTPMDKIHIMPNVWMMNYENAGPGIANSGTDLVVRLSIYYVYGK